MVDHVVRAFSRHFSLALAALALALTPALASTAQAASPVPLGTADSFALLAGSTITNAGSTTITGDIGLCCTGLATTGFGPGANQVTQPSGAQYIGPGSPAATAQDDLDIAYGNAAGQAVTNTVGVDLSLSDPLLPGVYRSGALPAAFAINSGLTLDFQGDPDAVFIFQGTVLETAVGAAGSVNIINGGAAPSTCNINWQLSSPSTGVILGAGSAFKGTTMALGASTLGTGATVEGRILTRRSNEVTLLSNTITRTSCFAAGPAATPAGTAEAPAADTPQAPGQTTDATVTRKGTAIMRRIPREDCTDGFRARVRGNLIKRVVFSLDGKRIASRTRSPFEVFVRALPGKHKVKARVTFKDATRAKTLTLGYRACAAVVLHPRRGPSRFTG